MAKKVSVTAQVNGGSAASHDVFMRNTEHVDFGPLFTFRLWKVFGLTDTDTLDVSSVTITTGVNDPMGGFDDPDWFRQISVMVPIFVLLGSESARWRQLLRSPQPGGWHGRGGVHLRDMES